MNWTKPRHTLKYTICKNMFEKYIPFTVKIAKQTIYEKICCYCGGKYSSFNAFNYGEQVEIACDLCFKITHINQPSNNNFKLLYSTMPQIDIIRKSINHMYKHNEYPHPTIIDPNVQTINLSDIEYSNILLSSEQQNFDEDNNIQIPITFRHIKYFITNDTKIEYINPINFAFIKQYDDTPINAYKYTQEDIVYLNKLFGCSS